MRGTFQLGKYSKGEKRIRHSGKSNLHVFTLCSTCCTSTWHKMADEDVQMQIENERKRELYKAKKGMR